MNEIEISEILINNKDEILREIAPYVISFLEREYLFKGIFKLPYERAFREFILSSVKHVIGQNFNLNWIDIYINIDYNLLDKLDLSNKHFFNKEKYAA